MILWPCSSLGVVVFFPAALRAVPSYFLVRTPAALRAVLSLFLVRNFSAALRAAPSCPFSLLGT